MVWRSAGGERHERSAHARVRSNCDALLHCNTGRTARRFPTSFGLAWEDGGGDANGCASQGQILALAFRSKPLKPFQVLPLRSDAVGHEGLEHIVKPVRVRTCLGGRGRRREWWSQEDTDPEEAAPGRASPPVGRSFPISTNVSFGQPRKNPGPRQGGAHTDPWSRGVGEACSPPNPVGPPSRSFWGCNASRSWPADHASEDAGFSPKTKPLNPR